jgi:hypothetical protein
MKAIDIKTAGYGLLISLAFLIIAVSTDAADFFPLDVWEEVTYRQPSSHGRDEALPEATRKAMSVPAGATATALLAFPFDVAEALNNLGGGDGRLAGGHTFHVNPSFKNHGNPYWLPEEYYPARDLILISGVETGSIALE